MNLKKGLILGMSILLIFLSLTFIFVLFTSEKQTITGKNISTVITIEKYGLVSYNEQNIPYVTFKTNLSSVNQTSISILWFNQKPLKKVYFLMGPSVQASNMKTVKEELKGYVEEYEGLEFDTCTPQNIDKIKNGVIIVTTGRLPQEIYNNLDTILKNNNVIIYVGMDIDYVIDSTGALIETHEKRSLKEPSRSWDVEYIDGWYKLKVKENGKVIGYILYLPVSPERTSTLAKQIFVNILYNKWYPPLSEKEYKFGDSQDYLTLFGKPAKSSHGYLRIITSIVAKNNNQSKYVYKIKDVEVNYPLVGRMFYKVRVLKGEPLDITIRLRAGYIQPVHLIMSLDFIHNNYIVTTEKFGDIKIKQVWESRNTIPNNLHPGDYIVSLHDQYGNVWALGYLHVSGLYAVIRDIKSGQGTLWVTIDGAPMTGTVKVYLDDKYLGKYKVYRGYLTLDLPKGEHTLRLVYKNSDWEFVFNNTSETLFDRYIKYLGPPLLIFIIVYIMFKRKKPVLYKLIVPKVLEEKTKVKVIKDKDILAIFRKLYKEFRWKIPLPLSIREFMYGIKKYLDPSHETYITEGNAIELLNQLLKKGIIVGYDDYYIPKNALNMDVRLAVIKRKVHDLLITLGVKFSEKEKYTETDDFIIFYGTSDKTTLENIKDLEKNKKIIIVFKDTSEKNEFLKRIMTSIDKFNLSLSIAIKTQKVITLSLKELRDYI